MTMKKSTLFFFLLTSFHGRLIATETERPIRVQNTHGVGYIENHGPVHQHFHGLQPQAPQNPAPAEENQRPFAEDVMRNGILEKRNFLLYVVATVFIGCVSVYYKFFYNQETEYFNVPEQDFCVTDLYQNKTLPYFNFLQDCFKNFSLCALTGLSGFGRKEAAIAFAAYTKNLYDFIYWIDCSTKNQCAASFEKVFVPDQNALVILDGDESQSIAQKSRQTHGKKPHILITTSITKGLFPKQTLDFPGLSLNSSIQLLSCMLEKTLNVDDFPEYKKEVHLPPFILRIIVDYFLKNNRCKPYETKDFLNYTQTDPSMQNLRLLSDKQRRKLTWNVELILKEICDKRLLESYHLKGNDSDSFYKSGTNLYAQTKDRDEIGDSIWMIKKAADAGHIHAQAFFLNNIFFSMSIFPCDESYLEWVESILSINQKTDLAWYLRGLWFLGLRCQQFKNIEEAEQSFQQAVDLNDASGLSAYQLGMIYYHRNDARAEQLLKQAAIKNVSAANSTLSAIYLAKGNNEEALAMLMKSAEDLSNIPSRLVLIKYFIHNKINQKIAYAYIKDILSSPKLSEKEASDYVDQFLDLVDPVAKKIASDEYEKMKIERRDIEEKMKQHKIH